MNTEIIKTATPVLSLILGYLIKGIVAAIKFADENKDKIAAIVKRVEADSVDGWTADEKKLFAWDLFKKEVYPRLPWYVKILPEHYLKSKFFAVIDKICKLALDLKKKDDAPKPA